MEPTPDTTTNISLDKDKDGAGPYGPGEFPGVAEPIAEPAPERPAFRLRRSKTDRMLGGVCGGLAESLGVDATLLRIGLVALTLLGAGSGVIIYAAIWLIAPETDTP
jgi:phage shock protein C